MTTPNLDDVKDNIFTGKFAKDGIEIGDRRAIALHEWLAANPGKTGLEIKAEIERLKKVIPAPEDNTP